MKNGRYVTALGHLIPANPKAWPESTMDVLEHAEEVDRLAAQIADDLRRNAERFTKAADRIAAGHFPEDPTGYSSLNDIATNCARHKAKTESLITLIRRSWGDGAKKAFFAVLRGDG